MERGVEEFVDKDRLVPPHSLLEHVPLNHLPHGKFTQERYDIAERECSKPLTIVTKFRFLKVEDFPYLTHISLHIGLHLLLRECFPYRKLPCRVSYHCGKVADKKHNLMPETLELAKFLKRNDMANME